jgi:hypothetical protein
MDALGEWVKTDKPRFTGTAEPESTVKVLLGEVVAGTATADANGAWSIEPETALPDDSYVAMATAMDAAGNISPPSEEHRFTLDTVPPNKPQVTAPAPLVNTTRPVIRGTADAGSTVTVMLDGKVEKTIEMVEGQLEWEFTVAEGLEPGDHLVSASAEDAAGNVSPPAEHSFLIPMSHYGWNCSSGPAFPVSGIWLVMLWWLRRRGGRPPACPPG